MNYLYEYGLFLAQAVTIVGALLIMVAALVAMGQRQRTEQHEGHIEIRNLNEKYRQIGRTIEHIVESPEANKARRKAEKKADKLEARSRKKRSRGRAQEQDTATDRARLYILSFHGDLKASATENLREEISAVLPRAREGDEVLVRVESPGGLVHGYGLAASQLQRIRDAKVPLTISVDKVAASGGYMMACVANRIIAAPFAVIGSIGVLAQLPNFHRFLRKHDIDFELLTAGEYKRTLTLFGENTDKGREKFVQELEETHQLFKAFVSENRPQLDISAVATGEVWYGRNALERGLIDQLQTSDAYIQERLADRDIYEVRFVHRKSWQEKLGMAAEGALERTLLRLWQSGLQRQKT